MVGVGVGVGVGVLGGIKDAGLCCRADEVLGVGGGEPGGIKELAGINLWQLFTTL